MAQSVEQLIRNQQVAGSSPASSSNKKGHEVRLVTFFIIKNAPFHYKKYPTAFLGRIAGSHLSHYKSSKTQQDALPRLAKTKKEVYGEIK